MIELFGSILSIILVTCGTLTKKKACGFSNGYTTIEEPSTVSQCQKKCKSRASSGKKGCCEFQVDWKKCIWMEASELKRTDDIRYGSLCLSGNNFTYQ